MSERNDNRRISYTYTGVERRDFRASKDGPEVTRAGRKKNTKKWCKGKEGREHGPLVWEPWHPALSSYEILRCQRCRKVMKWKRVGKPL